MMEKQYEPTNFIINSISQNHHPIINFYQILSQFKEQMNFHRRVFMDE